MRKLCVMAALLVVVLPAVRAADPLTVRLHSEGLETDGPSFVVPVDLSVPAKRVFIRKVPIISEKDIKAIFPFSNADGSLGCALLVNADGRQRVEEFSTSARGEIAVALINGRIAAAMQVNRRITDGIVNIAQGFKPEEILVLQSLYPTIGKEKEFRSQKKQALASLAKADSERARREKEARKADRKKAAAEAAAEKEAARQEKKQKSRAP